MADGGGSWQQVTSKPIRTINQLQTCSEISVVNKPAYDNTLKRKLKAYSKDMQESRNKANENVTYVEEKK